MNNFYLIKFNGELEEEYLYVVDENAYTFLLNKFRRNNPNEIITTFSGSSKDNNEFDIITLDNSQGPPPPPPGGGAVRMSMVRISVQSIVEPNANLPVQAAGVAQLLTDKDGAIPATDIIENLFLRRINEMKHKTDGGKKRYRSSRKSSSSRRRRSTKRRTTSRKQQKRRRSSRRAH